MELKQIGDGVFACLQAPGGLGFSNSGLIASGGGLVVDTFFDLRSTRDLIRAYASVWRAPPAQLVNTHHNGDHCWGNQLFAWAEIIGHRSCAELMSRTGPESLRQLAQLEAPEMRLDDLARALSVFDFSDIEVRPPTRLFEQALTLDTCGTRVDLHYVGPAHSASDVVVHLPEHGIVFAGDIVFERCTPFGWEGSYARWLDALQYLLALRPQVVVPGHGSPCGAEGIREMIAYLRYIRAEAERFFAAGLSVLEAAKRIDLGPFAAWGEAERVIFNVERAYREFAGVSDAPSVVENFRDMQLLKRFWSERARGGAPCT